MTRNWRIRRLLSLLLLIVLLAVACGNDFADSDAGGGDDSGDDAGDDGDDSGDFAAQEADGDDGGSTSAGGDDSADDMVDEEAPESEGSDDGSGLAVPTALTAADIGRDIVFRATIAVEVADVAAAGREATQVIQSLGGIVFGQTTTLEPEARTVLTFKLLPEDFDTALEQLAGVGDLVDQTISADDVTDRVVDLESRISTSEASVLRLRALLEGAGDVDIIADLERQLLDRETTLETLRGQLRTLRDQVSLATITLTITEKGLETLPAELVIDSWLGEDEPAACPGSGELVVSRDGEAVWCIEIENTGDVALLDLDLESDSLRMRVSDFTIRAGELAELGPGERLVAIVELDLEDGRVRRRDARGGLFLDVRATAVPADNPDGEVGAQTDVVLIAESDEPLPGFGDAFSGSLGALATAGSVLLIVLGAVIPFLVFAPFVWFGVRWWRRRGRNPLPDHPE